MAEVNDRRMLESDCPDCAAVPLSRREFVRGVGAGVLAASVPFLGRSAAAGEPVKVGPSPTTPAETAVARFYKTITPEQRKVICFPFDDPMRSMVNNNWDIVKPSIGEMSSEQQALCQEIMKNLCSEDGYERFTKQMEDDDGGHRELPRRRLRRAGHRQAVRVGPDRPARHPPRRWQQRRRRRLRRTDLLRPRRRRSQQ